MAENTDGKIILINSTSKQPGFDLPKQIWVTLNRFRTGHGSTNGNYILLLPVIVETIRKQSPI